MKVFVAFLLVVSTAYAGSMNKEYRVMKKWAQLKAMESCWGESNMKKWMVSMKKSAARCSGVDAPELDLPMFQSPYRVIQALLSNAERSEENMMNEIFHRLSNSQGGHSHYHTHGQQPQVVPVVVQSQESPMEQMMKHFFMAKMMKKMHKMHDMHDDEEDNSDFSTLFQKQKQGRYDDMYGQMRFKRQAGESKGLLDLGDRLNEKLMQQKMMVESKIGNFTCVLQDQGMLDANNELDRNGIQRLLEEYEYADEWFKSHVQKDHDQCYELSQNLPQSMVDECPYGPQIAKLKMFLHCMEKCKLKTCMHYDLKTKLEENFGPLSTLVAQTGLQEEELFPLVMKLLHGDMMDS